MFSIRIQQCLIEIFVGRDVETEKWREPDEPEREDNPCSDRKAGRDPAPDAASQTGWPSRGDQQNGGGHEGQPGAEYHGAFAAQEGQCS